MKAHSVFFAAAEMLAHTRPDIYFLLMGDDITEHNHELMGMIPPGLQDRVRLLGPRDDLPRLYPAVDITTLTSSWGEGFPNVLGEAMACGVPCVATDVGDVRRILRDTGWVVAPNNSISLSAAWAEVLALAGDARQRLALKVRDRAANFSMAQVVSLYNDVLMGVSLAEHKR